MAGLKFIYLSILQFLWIPLSTTNSQKYNIPQQYAHCLYITKNSRQKIHTILKIINGFAHISHCSMTNIKMFFVSVANYHIQNLNQKNVMIE